jgi:uncharacterized protein
VAPGEDGAAFRERLARVLDPELDESILDLGFVRSVRLDSGRASVALRLPTSWCALLGLEGVREATVSLDDHCAAAEIEAAGFEAFRRMLAEYPIAGLKLYTAEWRNGSRGWRLNDPWAYKYLSVAQELGVKNIHVHKGPTVYPLSADAFYVHEVDYAATDFPGLNFIVEHVGLPRLDDFCWIAAQEQNVYAGQSVAMAFVHLRPRYFGEIMANLLFWLGPDKLCFGSDYAIWSPKWLIDRFMAFELPEDLKQEYRVDLTPEVKRKILGGNAARPYGIDIPEQAARLGRDGLAGGRP